MLIVKVDELIDEIGKLNAEIKRLRAAIHAPFEITEGVVITADEARDIFRNHLPHNTFLYELLDTSYFIPKLEDTQQFITWLGLDRAQYIPQRRDCDNFGMYAAAAISIWMGVNPIFAVWDFSSMHFYNFILTPTNDVYVYEPQTGEITTIGEFKPDPLHKLERGKIYGF